MSSNDINKYLEHYDIKNYPVKIQTTTDNFFDCVIEEVLNDSLVIIYNDKCCLINFNHIVFIEPNPYNEDNSVAYTY